MMRFDRSRGGIGAFVAVLISACTTGLGCASLSYPEPPSAGTQEALEDSTSPYLATESDPHAWVALSSAGRDAMRLRDYEAAEQNYVAALAETGVFSIHDTRVRTALGNVLRVAQAQQRLGAFEAAERLIGVVVASAEAGRLADFKMAAPIFAAQAHEYTRRGESEKAIALYETALTLSGASDPAQIEQRIEFERLLGNAYIATGRPDEAEPLLLSVLRSIQSLRGPESVDASRALSDVAQLRQQQNDFEAAEHDYLRALTIQEREISESLELALNHERLAKLYLDHDRNEEAIRHALQSLSVLNARDAEGAAGITALDTVATAETRLGKLSDARAHFAQALALYDEADQTTRAELADMLDHYAELLRSTGDDATATHLVARAARERAPREPASE